MSVRKIYLIVPQFRVNFAGVSIFVQKVSTFKQEEYEDNVKDYLVRFCLFVR